MSTPKPATVFPPRPSEPTPDQIKVNIEAALTVQRRAMQHGKRPFASVLIGPDNSTVLLSHQSVDHVNHSEASLCRLAASHYTQAFLWTCTLYSTWEPCAMCTATLYWSNIGRVVYAASNDQLGELTGKGNEENFTMEWGTRDVLKGCPQKDIQVWGPLDGLDKVVMKEADVYWAETRRIRGI
jgi:tRNA(Arg) A34 adenosine deaminase TadA